MAVQRMTVKITPTHIKNARPDAWRRNPVALAFRDAGFRFVKISQAFKDYAIVARSSRGLQTNGRQPYEVIDLPKKVYRFLERYSKTLSSPKKRKKLKPLSFVVKMTPEVQKAFSAVRHIEGVPNRLDEEVEIELKPAA